MGVVHIVLVGTSVWRNLASALEGRGLEQVKQHLESRGLATSGVRDAVGRCARARPGSHEDVECGRLASGGSPAARAALEAVGLDPRGVSAELNAMWPWLEAWGSGSRGALAGVYLVHSDTGAGGAAADVLRRYLESLGVRAEAVLVRGLGSPGSLASGLSELYRLVSQLAERHSSEGECVLLNPTGGFKVESGYALLAAMRRALAAYYIHETFRDVVILPLPPLHALAGQPPSCSEGWCKLPATSKAHCAVEALKPVGAARAHGGTLEIAEWLLTLH